MKFIFIADIFEKDLPTGGGEKSNQEFLKQAKKLGWNFITIHSYLLKESQVKEWNKAGWKFIIANFMCLAQNVQDYITKNCKYIIIEHDHKYIAGRNPGKFKDFLASDDFIINFEFYQNAKAVICQSKLHKEVAEKNLRLTNIKSLGGNFWSDEELDYIIDIRKEDKRDIASIPNFSGNLSKGTDKAISYCMQNNIKYQLIENTTTKDFLDQLSVNKYLVFIPRTLETLSRIVIEAKMLDITVKTIKPLIGACSEPWWDHLKSVFLALYMKDQKPNFCNFILNSFND